MEYLHPMTVHFTIALFSLAVLFEVLGWLFMKDSLKAAAWWNLLFAVPSVIVSVLSGRKAESSVPHNEQIHEVIEIHETFGYIVLSVIVVLFLWRTLKSEQFYKKLQLPFIILAIMGFGVMTVGTYFGGELVFTHGVGVKPMMELMAEEGHDHSSHGTVAQEHDDTDSHVGQDRSHGEYDSESGGEREHAQPDKEEDHDHGSHKH